MVDTTYVICLDNENQMNKIPFSGVEIFFSQNKDKKEESAETGLKEVDPIEKAEKDFFKIVEEEKSKKKKRMVTYKYLITNQLFILLK